MRSRRRVLAAFLVVVLTAGLAVAVTRPSRGVKALTVADVDKRVNAAVGKAAKDAAATPSHAAQVYGAILPSVVLIATSRPAAGASDPAADAEDGTGADAGLGTGVIVNAEGTILTARHVIAGASTIKVTYADGTTVDATVASEQAERDIAVLAPAGGPEVLVPAVLASSRGVRVGDEAFAVGHPLQLVDSMSAGVISGLGRSIPVEGGGRLDGLIQFDTAVNPGNSGGPLLNRDGQVIGIVTALANPAQQNFFVGIGFAVPIEAAGGGAGAPAQ